MNQNLKEIANAAGYSNDVIRLLNLSLFAEAVVRACADVALREDHDPAECILTHFGIE